MLTLDNIDSERMDAVLRYMHIRALWREIQETYINFHNIPKDDAYKYISPEEWDALFDVFDFKWKHDAAKCRGQLLNWLKQEYHQQFYHDTMRVLIARLREARQRYNKMIEENPDTNEKKVRYVNHIDDIYLAVFEPTV